MNKPSVKFYGLPIHVGSETGTKIRIITDSKQPYIAMSRQIYDFLMIAGGKEHGWSSDKIDSHLTRPRDDLFKSLANQEVYLKLLNVVCALKREAIEMGQSYLSVPDDLLKCPLCQRLPILEKYTVDKDKNGHIYESNRMYYGCVTDRCAFRPQRESAAVDEEFAILQWNTFVTDALNNYPDPCIGGEI